MQGKPVLALLAMVGFAASVLLIATQAAAVPPGTEAPVAETDKGQVIGELRGDVAVFLGIPYAAPTGGAARFRPAQPREPWSTPLEATELAAPCAQTAQLGMPSTNEDCLIVNVFAPRQLAGRRPVMVFVHGGFYTGSSSNPFDATALVEQAKVVVITVNYRLGAFGMLALPGLVSESPNGTAGNYAVLDQQAALRWVQRNIENFGGDPRNVTYFGQSAGAGFLTAHLVAPESANLFARGISQSLPGQITRTLAQAQTVWLTAINRANLAPPQGVSLGCPTTLAADELVSCLRAAPADKVAAIATVTTASPIVDGRVIPVAPLSAFRSGEFHRVPVIVGSNRDEGTFFVSAPITSQAAYEANLAGRFGPGAVPGLLAQYPASRFGGSFTQAFAAAMGDQLISCNSELTRQALSAFVPVYGYEFSQPNPALLRPVPSIPGLVSGATHTAELAYVFGTAAGAPLPPGADLDLSEKMIAYWTSFAHGGDPNVPAGQGRKAGFEDRPDWPAYGGREPSLLSLSTPVSVESVAAFNQEHTCAFWNPVP